MKQKVNNPEEEKRRKKEKKETEQIRHRKQIINIDYLNLNVSLITLI